MDGYGGGFEEGVRGMGSKNQLLAELLEEKQRLGHVRTLFPHCMALIDEEILRMQSMAADPLEQGHTAESLLSPGRRGQGALVRRRLKLHLPSEQFPDYNFVGRLLGPRGTTLQAMERETGCRIMIRGRGSVRRERAEEVRGKPGYEHLFNEPLHLIIEAEMEERAAVQALRRAKHEVEAVLVLPMTDRRHRSRDTFGLEAQQWSSDPVSARPSASPGKRRAAEAIVALNRPWNGDFRLEVDDDLGTGVEDILGGRVRDSEVALFDGVSLGTSPGRHELGSGSRIAPINSDISFHGLASSAAGGAEGDDDDDAFALRRRSRSASSIRPPVDWSETAIPSQAWSRTQVPQGGFDQPHGDDLRARIMAITRDNQPEP